MKTLFQEITHLEIPGYATEEIRFPKWSVRVNALREPRVLKITHPRASKADAIVARDSALAKSRECATRARKCRKEASSVYGDAGEPMPYPISGGVCDHWPEKVKDYVGGLARLAVQWDSLARAWHVYAGKRIETFPREWSGI